MLDPEHRLIGEPGDEIVHRRARRVDARDGADFLEQTIDERDA